MAVPHDSRIGSLRIFNPSESDWRVYKDQLNQYFIINNINEDEVKRGLLLNMCSETTHQLISNLCFPAKPETEGFEALITMLDNYFTPPKLILHERQVYYEAKKNYEESVVEWAARVKQLARNCEFSSDQLEIALRDRFVCGLPKGPIKDKLYEEMPEGLTFEKAVEIARNKEASCKLNKTITIPLPDFLVEQDTYDMRRRPRRLSGDPLPSRRNGTKFRPRHLNLLLDNPFPYPSCSASLPPPRSRDIRGKRAYYWVDSTARSVLPSTALHGGVDMDGSQIYVGRAFHDGDWIPAKVIPSKRVAYIPYGGKEHAKDRFQVLCEQRFDWVPSHGGIIPPGAVDGGRTSAGETLYIGRVHHKGSHTVGKVHPSHKVCYIPFDGKEVPYQQYEILVLRA